MQPHWCDNRLSGIALCAVVSFPESQDPVESFSVKCTIHFETEDGSRVRFDCDVGELTEPGKIESDHVFIGYASFSRITNHLEDKFSGNSTPTKASLEFCLSDACTCEVLNCGLSLVYADPQNLPVDENQQHTSSSSEMGGDLVETYVLYVSLAFVFLILFDQDYLKRLNSPRPRLKLASGICVMAFLWFMIWKRRKQKQQQSGETPGFTAG